MELKLSQQEILLFDNCIKANGVSAQMRQYNEEHAEALLALAKYQRALQGGEPEEIEQRLREWKSEMADAIIMNLQMAHIYGMSDVLAIIHRKLDRQQERINKSKENV